MGVARSAAERGLDHTPESGSQSAAVREREGRTNKTDVRPMMRKPQIQTHLSLRCVNIVQVDRPLVGQKAEDIQRPDGFWPPLFVAEY